MTTTAARKNLSVSLPADLAKKLDAWAEADQTSRSAVLARLLKEEDRRRFEIQLEQDYKDAAADGFYDDIEFYLPAQAEVALAEPAWPETGGDVLAGLEPSARQ